MPWALLVRWIVRVALGMFAWRVASARRGAAAPGTRPPLRRGWRPPRLDPSRTAAALRESASIGWRAVGVLVFGAAALLLITAGVTTTVLSPRWLGELLLALAVLALVGVAVEARILLRLLALRRRRRHDQALRGQVN